MSVLEIIFLIVIGIAFLMWLILVGKAVKALKESLVPRHTLESKGNASEEKIAEFAEPFENTQMPTVIIKIYTEPPAGEIGEKEE
ncbi:MAG: hypothetical protein LBM93_05700 [Oscillospiraceae bacterium]|nr:hypothetical protein [Oscillospiraceae bacterium]